MVKLKPSLLLIPVVILLPAIISVMLIHYSFGAGTYDFMPAWNDEIDYWHEILTFSKYNFNGGYYTIEEVPPQAAFTHFGAHGPAFPIIYGSIAKVAGWHHYSSLIFNLTAISITIAVFFYIAKPDTLQLLLSGGVILTFWPMFLYIPTAMQESLHHALAIVLASAFFRLIKQKRDDRLLSNIIIFVFLVFASLLRPTWSILFFPFFLLNIEKIYARKIIYAISFAISGVFVSFILFSYLSSPYPENFIHKLLKTYNTSLIETSLILALHLAENIKNILSIWESIGTPLEITLRYEVMFLTVFSLFRLCCSMERSEDSNYGQKAEHLFHFFNLGAILSLNLLFYDTFEGRDYRVMAPHLLMSLLILALTKRTIIVIIAVLASIAVIPNFTSTYRGLHEEHFIYTRSIPDYFRNKTADHMIFNKNEAPWGNSLLIDINDYRYPLTEVPAGIGINAVIDWDRIMFPVKSKYVFISPAIYEKIKDKSKLQLLSSGMLGNLYLNLDYEALPGKK